MGELLQNKVNITEEDDLQTTLKKIALGLFYILPAFSFNNGELYPYIALIELGLMIVLMATDMCVYLFPITICFYEQLVAPGGIVVYRVYTVLMIVRFAFDNKELKLDWSKLAIMLVSVIYIMFLMVDLQSISPFTRIFDLLVVTTLTLFYLNNDEIFITFMKYFIVAILVSGFAGIFLESANSITPTITNGGQYMEIRRFNATFEDPNYLCFFVNIAILSLLNLPLFKGKFLNLLLFIGLVLMIISSASTTGLFTLAVVIMFSCLNIKPISKGIAIIVGFTIIGLLIYMFSKIIDLGFITDTFIRLEDKIYELLVKRDMNSFTTNRFGLWAEQLEYFINQPVLNVLFGGNRINCLSFDSAKFNGASHQEYIALLLNVGLVGFLIIITSILLILIKQIRYIKINRDVALTKIGIKFIWLFYAFGLTMFLDTRFYFFLLL